MESNPQFIIGKVTEVTNEEFQLIKFTVPGYIEDASASPMAFIDEVKRGDEVLILSLDRMFKTSHMYLKRKTDEHIRFRYGTSAVTITDTKVDVEAININIISSVSTKISGNAVANPATPGPLCGLPTCLYTGLPHVTDRTIA